MKKLFLSIAAMSMILATGCQNEELVQQTSADEYSLTLDMSAGSRTLHNAAGECVWGDNEQLYVVGDGGKVYGTLTMKSKSADGKKAVFSGKVVGDPAKLRFMVYPVPETDGTIPMGNIDGTNHNAPMTGQINANGVVTDVDYAGGLIKVPVTGISDMVVSAENKAGKVVTGGVYTFNPATGELTFDPDGGTPIYISNIEATNGFVYVPVETDVTKESTEQTEEVTVEVTIGEGAEEQTQSFPAEVQEGAITTEDVPSFDVDEESGVMSVTVSSETQLAAALANGGEVILADNIELSKVIAIEEKIEVAIDLNGYAIVGGEITNNGKLTITSTIISAENVSSFTLKGNGNTSIQGGIYDNNNLTLADEFVFVEYSESYVVLPNEYKGYAVACNKGDLESALSAYASNIVFANNIEGTITIVEKADNSLVIDGNNYKFDGQIKIKGNSAIETGWSLKLKNINFETSKLENASIWSFDDAHRYINDIEINNCTFTATGDAIHTAVGIKFRQAYRINVVGCKAEKMHSLLQATSSQDEVSVDLAEIVDCKNGISFSNGMKAIVSNTTITSVGDYGYGIRVDGNGLEINNCTINAFVPVLVRKVKTAGFNAIFSGINEFTALNENAYQVVFSATDYDDENPEPVKPSVDFTVTGIDGMKVFGK